MSKFHAAPPAASAALWSVYETISHPCGAARANNGNGTIHNPFETSLPENIL
jgi:hypothetical protein